MKKVTTNHYIGGVRVTLTSDVVNGRELDTLVQIGDEPSFWIAGSTKEAFLDDFKKLVENYRI